MSDTNVDGTANEGEPEPESDETNGRNVGRYANHAVVLVLGLLAVIAVIQLYLSVSDVIRTWIEPEYRSLFQAAFNLVVLLAAGLGISYQLRRLYG
jgi:hypothetical protein